MLVKFDSEVGSVTLFGDVAVQLLKIMGHSGTIPSALLAEDIPEALSRLKAATEAAPAAAAAPTQQDGDADEPRVSLRQRAYPLIELLTRAAQRGVNVTWTAG